MLRIENALPTRDDLYPDGGRNFIEEQAAEAGQLNEMIKLDSTNGEGSSRTVFAIMKHD